MYIKLHVYCSHVCPVGIVRPLSLTCPRVCCCSLEELYQAVENMCSHRMAAKLYDSLRVECERHVRSLAPVFRQYPLTVTTTATL